MDFLTSKIKPMYFKYLGAGQGKRIKEILKYALETFSVF